MKRQSRVALAAAILTAAGSASAQAAFTITMLPSLEAAPAGKTAFDFFAQNDQADTSDGINLQAVKIVFTGTNGSRVFFNTADLANGTTPETYSSDQYNFGAGTSGTNITDPGSSNLRIGTRTAGQHAFPNYPGDADSPISATDAVNGLASWSADYAVLRAEVSVPTPTTPGARFARLVFNTATPTGSIVCRLVGEVGDGSTIGGVPPPSLSISPSSVSLDVSPVGLEAFGPVLVTTFSSSAITNTTVPAKIADNISITGTGNTRTISGSGFTYSDIGAYVITFSAGTAIPASFILTIIPEPTILGAMAGLALVSVRRHRRSREPLSVSTIPERRSCTRL